MVDALTFSCRVGRWILFLLSAITGRSLLFATLQYFVTPMNLFLFLTRVLLKDVHLDLTLQLQPCNPIGGNEDQMIVCTVCRIVAMVTDPTAMSDMHLIAVCTLSSIQIMNVITVH